MLLEAQDWRNRDVLPQFANGKAAAKDQLNLTHVKTFEHLYNRKDLPNLRIIRVRTIGSGETPQYFAVREDEETLKRTLRAELLPSATSKLDRVRGHP